jgi:outer membrane receptor protein involved in Fe transport
MLTGDGTNVELPNTTEDELRGRASLRGTVSRRLSFPGINRFSDSSSLATSVYERFVSSRLVPTSDPFSIQAGGLRNDIAVGIKSDYSLFINSTHAIKAGVDVAGFRLREDFSFDPRENDVEIDAFDLRGRKTGGEQSAYIQDKIQITRDLTVNLGLRYDHYNIVTSGQSFSPRLNLAYALNKHRTVLHFAYNRFFAPPSIENLLLSAHLGFDGSPPQISRSNFFEGGASQSITDKFVLRMTAFWRSDKNSFENTELANVHVFAPTTFAKGSAYGLEVSGQLAEIPGTGLSGFFSYTAQRVFQTDPISGGFTIENVERGETGPAAFDQVHTAVAGITEREHRSGIFVTAQFEYGSGTPASLPDASGNESLVRLPGHFVANLYFGIDLFRKEKHSFALQFNVENVGDRVFRIAKESEFTPVQYSPPRFLSGSLRFRF